MCRLCRFVCVECVVFFLCVCLFPCRSVCVCVDFVGLCVWIVQDCVWSL